jgi:ribosomal protein L37AE/L43A
MAATTTTNNRSDVFIGRLAHDYPDYSFEPGKQEHWSPKTHTITFNPDQPLKKMRYGVLHELAHALLEHTTYQSDFELLQLESKAWEMADKIGHKYGVVIDHDHIQRCLDTYRDWLHQRSSCPTCGTNALQQDATTYHCFNCQTQWQVSADRFARSYRKTKATKNA